MEQDDDVLGFSKTNIRFEEREFERKLANGHAELVFWKKCRIIQIDIFLTGEPRHLRRGAPNSHKNGPKEKQVRGFKYLLILGKY